MPTYTVRDPRSNRTLTVRGDSPPTEQELQQLFASAGAPSVPADQTHVPATFSRFNDQPITPDAPPDMRPAFNRTVGAMLSDLNPVPLAKGVWDAASQTRFGSPELAYRLIAPLIEAQSAQFGKAKTAYDEGRTSEAIGYGAAGMLPLIGPAAARAGETMATTGVPEGIGQGLALLLSLGLPKLLKGAVPESVTVPPLMRNPNPAIAEAVDWGLARGIPVDLGTASGSGLVRGATAMTEHTPAGMLVGRQAGQQTAAALTREGQGLAARSFPRSVTPDLAGQYLQKGLETKAKTHAGEANVAYRKLREIEGAPESERLIAPITGETLSGVTSAEMGEVRRMLAELEEIQYTRRGMQETTGQGSAKEWTAGHRNAYVYEDIMREAGSPIPATALRGKIEAVMNGEKPNVWFTRAVEVARKRLAGDKSVHQPLLPPEAGEPASLHTPMQAPVDLRPVKAAFMPVLQDLEGQLEALKGLPGGMRLEGADQAAAQTLANVRRLMELPDQAPASAVDPLLSTMKRYVAKADSPLSRSRGQGLIAKAIGDLETQLSAGLAELGPEAGEALTAGREATKAKYATLEARKGLGKKSVLAYRKMIQPGDANLEQLQTMATMQPQALPVVARSYLQGLLERATSEGGFQHAARLRSEWQKLGPKTKALLFRDPAYVKDLDRFFTLAAEGAGEYNPSRTALTGMAWGSTVGTAAGLVVNPVATVASLLGTGAFAKAMHSPAFVRALVQGMTLPVRARAQRVAAVERAIVAARSAGVEAGAVSPALAGDSPAPRSPDTTSRLDSKRE